MKLAAIVLTASALSLSPALAQTSGTDGLNRMPWGVQR